jgi:hypothetical protein
MLRVIQSLQILDRRLLSREQFSYLLVSLLQQFFLDHFHFLFPLELSSVD